MIRYLLRIGGHKLEELLMSIKIISGGQTGVDRGALDAALELDFPCGGYCPEGRMAEDGVIEDHYPLIEIPGGSYEDRTRKNVEESDGTLIISPEELSGGTKLTKEICEQLGKPYLQITLVEESDELLNSFVLDFDIKSLNVAGPRESEWKGGYQFSKEVILRYLKSVACLQQQHERSMDDKCIPHLAPEIDCEFILLRPLRETDRTRFARLSTDPKVREFLGGPISRTEANSKFEALLINEKRDVIWVISEPETEAFMGIVDLSRHVDSKDTEISYMLLPEYWGQGFAGLACEAVIDYAFEELFASRIVAETQAANLVSRRLLTSLGFVLEETLNRHGEEQVIYAVDKRSFIQKNLAL